MPTPLAHYQGRIVPLEHVSVPALDRGFLFGDAVYEVLRVYRGRAWLEAEHWRRLAHSLEAIRIDGVDLDRLRANMHATIAAGPFTEAMVYVQISRGSAPRRRHAFPAQSTPLELLWVEDYDDGPTAAKRQSGVAVITHPDLRWKRCDIKSTNLLANVLAYQTAVEKGAAEALLYLEDGTMTEASHSSFFWVKAGRLYMTPGRDNILPGITREYLTKLAAQEGTPLGEAHLRRQELNQVDELFLTGTTSEVLPVVAVDGIPIGNGTPGPISRRFVTAHQRAVEHR